MTEPCDWCGDDALSQIRSVLKYMRPVCNKKSCQELANSRISNPWTYYEMEIRGEKLECLVCGSELLKRGILDYYCSNCPMRARATYI